MVYIDLTNKEKYDLILEFIFSQCNKAYFHLPNFQNSSNDIIKINDNGNINSDYIEYVSKNSKFLNLCFKNNAQTYISKKYLDVELAYMTKVFSVKLFEEFKQLLKSNHLFDWKYPVFPEDVCFFNNSECKFKTIAHEETFILLNETQQDINFLKTNKISYFKI